MVFTGVEMGAGAADGVEVVVVGFAGSAVGFCGAFGAFGALAGFHIFGYSSQIWIACSRRRSKSVSGGDGSTLAFVSPNCCGTYACTG
jgi:hypothetical protein